MFGKFGWFAFGFCSSLSTIFKARIHHKVLELSKQTREMHSGGAILVQGQHSSCCWQMSQVLGYFQSRSQFVERTWGTRFKQSLAPEQGKPIEPNQCDWVVESDACERLEYSLVACQEHTRPDCLPHDALLAIVERVRLHKPTSRPMDCHIIRYVCSNMVHFIFWIVL